MNVNPVNTIKQNDILYSQTAFASVKARRLIEKVENAKQLKKIEITFDELEMMYDEIGYDIFKKRGSHATVTLDDKITIAIIMPHGQKYVRANDLKRFLLVKEGKFLEASRVH